MRTGERGEYGVLSHLISIYQYDTCMRLSEVIPQWVIAPFLLKQPQKEVNYRDHICKEF